MNWDALFGVHMPVAEIILRGSAIYWFLFVLFRFVMHRDIGAVGIADVLLLVIVADAAQNAMAGEYKSITEGMILIATIVGWNLMLDWLASRFALFERLAAPPPLILVRNGRIYRAHLRKEMMTLEDLMSKLRREGIQQLGEVKEAWMESDGEISVIRRRGTGTGADASG